MAEVFERMADSLMSIFRGVEQRVQNIDTALEELSPGITASRKKTAQNLTDWLDAEITAWAIASPDPEDALPMTADEIEHHLQWAKDILGARTDLVVSSIGPDIEIPWWMVKEIRVDPDVELQGADFSLYEAKVRLDAEEWESLVSESQALEVEEEAVEI